MLHLFNIFRENDGKENCSQVLEEEVYKMFGTKSLNEIGRASCRERVLELV